MTNRRSIWIFLGTLGSILFFVLLVTGLSRHTIEQDVSVLHHQLDQLAQAEGEEAQKESARALEQYWNTHCVDRWSTFLLHGTIKEIDTDITRLCESCQQGHTDHLQEDIAVLRCLLDRLEEQDRLSLTNLLCLHPRTILGQG